MMTVHQPIKKHVTRIIVQFGKKILLTEKEAAPGLLELPGGQRKHNEGLKAAALRELKEETGLVATPKQLRRWGHATLTTTHDAGARVLVTIYVLQLDAKGVKPVRPRNEIVRCRWRALPKLLTDPAVERKSGLILRYFHLIT